MCSSDLNLDASLQSGLYTIAVRARDVAGNTQTQFTAANSSFTITVDKDAPTIAISQPVLPAYTPAAASALGIQGTAADPLINGTSSSLLAGGVDVLLWHVIGPTSWYWTGGAFSTTLTTVSASGTNWSMGLVPSPAQYAAGGGGGDKVYYTMARVHDQSTYSDGSPSASTGNVSAFTPVTSFIVDGTVPVSTATGITDGGYINALTVLNGTHNGAMAGTDKVEIRITTNPVTGPDWTGSSYTFTTPYWTTATLAGLNWTYSDLTGAFTDNQLYFVYVRATDLVGNVQTPVPVYGVRYDVTPPAVSISFPNSPPANPAYSNNAESVRVSTYVYGSVSDSGGGASGIAQVWLAISSGAAQNVWWNEAARDFTTSQATVAWSTQTYRSGTSWQYSVPELQTALADGVNYSVFVYARDVAGNTVNFSVGMLPGASAAGQTQPFKYDVTRPTSTTSVPVNGTAVNALTAFSGSGTDAGFNASGVLRNYMAIRHVDGGAAPIGWWNWTTGAFDNGISDPPPAPPSAAWTQVSSTTVQGLGTLAWSTAVPAGMLESSATYRVVSAALDNATNLQQGATPVGSGSAFRYDVQIPTAVVATPAYGAYLNAATLGQLSGTANDELTGASGLQAVQILLKMENDQAYWNGGTAGNLSDYDSTPGTKYGQWRTVTGTTNWTQAFPPMPAPSKNFRVWVRVIDRAGNASATPSNLQLDNNQNADGTPARMFNYDDSPPVTEVSYPAQFVSFVPATITGTAQDTQLALNPSGVVDVRLRMTRTTGEYWNLFTSTWSAAPLGFSNTSLTGLNPWTFSNFTGAFVDGYRYDVNPQGVDASANVESPSFSTYSFIVDLSTPASSVLWPNTGAFVSSAAVTIRGVAEDRYCGLNPATCNASRQYESGMTSTMVAVAVAEVVVSTTWWDGAAFTSGSPIFLPASFVGSSSGTWTFALPPGALTSTKYYKAVVRAKDRAGNIDLVTSTSTFVYDAAAPVAYATAPTGFNGLVTTIYGTARDDIPDVPSVVRLTIREISPVSQYWNGTGWQVGAVELSSGVVGSLITGTTYAWSFDATTVNFINAATYTVTARGVDGAGNVEAAHGSPDIQFYLEAPTPSLVMTQPSAPDLKHYGPNSAGPVLTILGTGQNLRTTAGVRVALQRLTEPTSYWYEPTQSWTNDAATYTPVNVAAGSPQTWTLSLTAPYDVFDASYSITATPVNNASLLGTAVSRTFVFDRTIPLNGITNPAAVPCQGANACLSSLPTISGTASDATNTTPPSITAAGVKFRLKNAVTGDYWNGTAFAPGIVDLSIDPGNFSGAGPFSWSTTTLAGPALLDGEDYTILAHAADKAANDQSVEAAMANFTFIYDTSTPTGMLSQPSSGHVYLNLTTISGTSVDPGGANANNKFSGVQRVELQIFSPVDGVCWSDGAGSFSVGCPNFFVATGTTPWSYTHAALTGALVSGQPYTLTARAIDFAGNVQASFSVPLSSRTMSVDKGAPTTAFTKPLSGVAYRSSQLTGGSAITGTAADSESAQYQFGDALQSVQTVMWYVLGGTSYYYTGVVDQFPSGNGTKFSSNTVEAAQWLNVTTGTDTWTSLFAGADWISDRQYYAKARARDRARDVAGAIVGNLQNSFVQNVSYNAFKVDDTPPVSAVSTPAVTGFLRSLSEIAGTSNSDLSYANTYYLRVWYVVGVSSFYWNGNAWGAANVQTQLPVSVSGSTGTIVWTYPGALVGYTAPTITQPDGTAYGVAIQALDNAGNLETPTTALYVLDQVGPSVTISTPMASLPNYGAGRPLTVLNGVSNDSPAGVARVDIEIRQVSDTPNLFWNGSAWTAVSSFVPVASTNPWTYAAPAWIDNKQYSVRAKAVDLAGNDSGFGAPVVFKYDVNKPSTTILVPNQPFYPLSWSGTPLSGTALDWVNNPSTEAKSGLQAVEIAISRLSDGFYWQGGVFNAPVAFRTVSTTTLDPASWTYPPSNPAGDSLPGWNDNESYTVDLRATDKTGNVENLVSYTFTFDSFAPTTTISTPIDQSYATAFSLSSGTYSSVPAAVSQILVAVRNNLNQYWNGTAFVGYAAGSSWLPAQIHASSWTFTHAALSTFINTTQTDPRPYEFFVRGIDAAGNDNRGAAQPTAGTGRTLIVDYFRPVSSITYPTDNSALPNSVTPITGTAEDKVTALAVVGAGLSVVNLKVVRIGPGLTENYWDGGAWNPVDQGFNIPTNLGGAPQTVQTFASLNGAIGENSFLDSYRYRVTSQAQDVFGFFETVMSTVNFVVDRATPTATVLRPVHGSYISTNTLTLSSGTFSEPVGPGGYTSGLQQVRLQIEDVSDQVVPAHAIPGGNQRYWNGTGWQAVATSTTAVVYTSTWTVFNIPTDWVRGDASPNGRQYAIRAIATDLAGNAGAFPNYFVSRATFTFDGTPPDSTVVFPAGPDDADTTNLATITGTAADPLINASSSDVRAVYISIENDATNPGDPNAGFYWNGLSNTWVAGRFWNATTFNVGTGEWQFSSPPLDSNLNPGSFYIIHSSATDNAGNVQPLATAGQPGRRRLKFTPPPAATTIASPASLQYYNQLVGFGGTANPAASSIELQLRRLDGAGDQCWGGGTTGFGWVNCVPANGTNTRVVYQSAGSWAYPPGGESMPDWSLVNNTTFTLQSVGVNFASVRESPVQLAQFYIDRSSPVSSVSFPANGAFLASTPTLAGAVNDQFAGAGGTGSGIKNVKIELRRLDNNFYWNQLVSTWTAAVAQSTAAYNQPLNTWSFSSIVSTLTWQNGLTYSLAVFSEDKAVGSPTGNIEVPGAPINFTFDATQPAVAITVPAAGARVAFATPNALISGTASATAPNTVREVQFRVQQVAGSIYANPASALAFNQADGNLAWFNAVNGGGWATWSVSSGIPFVSGGNYLLIARAQNQSGTFTVPYSTYTLTYDTAAPQSVISAPANLAVINALPAINGLTADYPAGNPGTVVQMRARLKRLSDGAYWDGFSAWNPLLQTLGPGQGVNVAPPNWSFAGINIPTAGDLTSGASYYLTVSGLDDAANVGPNAEPFDSPAGSTFTFDNTAPTSGVSSPADASFRNSLTAIAGVSGDAIGVSTVALSVRDVTAAQCYNPAVNGFNLACPAWFPAQGSTQAWSFAFPAQPWAHATQYVIRSSATDVATNVQTSLSSAAFTYDVNAATAGLTTPAGGALGPSLGNIAGTATDAPAGVSSLRLAITSGTTAGNWWNGANFNAANVTPTFFATSAYVAGAPDTWAWAYPALADGQLYTLRARTVDHASNQRDQDFSFRFDSSSPTASIAVPVNGGFRTGVFAITGGSSDVDPDGAGPKAGTLVSTVAVSIELLGSGNCLVQGGGFTAGCPNYLPASGVPGAWTYTPVGNPYATGNTYVVTAQARDNAGNTQDVFVSGTSSNTFTYNTAVPTVDVTYPQSARHRDLSTLYGTANDAIPSALAKVQVRVLRLSAPARYADPADFGTPHAFSILTAAQETAWFDAASTAPVTWTAWSLSSGLPFVTSEQYRVEARALNQAGTYSTTYSSRTLIYDVNPPVTTVLLPVVASTVSALPTLSGASNDQPLGNGGSVAEIRLRLVRLSDGSFWTGSGWTGATSQLTTAEGIQIHQTSWTLTSNLPSTAFLTHGGSYYVTTSGVDDAVPGGSAEAFNEAPRASTFTADLVGPVTAFTAPANGSVISSLSKFVGTASDALAGVATASQVEVAIMENGPNHACWNGVIPGTFTAAACSGPLTPNYFVIDGGFGRGGTYSSGSTFWDMNVPALTSQFGYKVWVRARDNATPAGNVTAPAAISSVTFTYNTNLPSAAILVPPSLPATGGNLNAAFGVSGTASDAFGVTGTSVAFQEADTNMYWNGVATFSSVTPVWQNAALLGTAPNYTFTAAGPAPAASTGRNYNLFVKVINNAGLEQVAPAVVVKWDTTRPVAAVTTPANNTFGRALPSVVGSAADAGGAASGVAGSQVQIKRTAATDCWGGAAWGANCSTEASWLSPIAGTPWTKNTQLPPPTNNASGLEDGVQYEIAARAFDVATNTQTALTPRVFTFDVSSPTVANQLPAHGGRYAALATISGTAADTAPGAFNVTFPRVRIYDIPLNQYWVDGTGWVTSAFPGFPDLWNTAVDSTSVAGVFTWRYNAAATGLAAAWPDRDNQLRVETQAVDAAGNYTTASSTFSFDATRPGSYVLYPPLDGVTYSTMAVIGGTSTDNTSPITDVGIKMWYVSAGSTYYWSPAVPHWNLVDPGFASIGGSAGPSATINPWAYNSTQVPDFANPGTLNYAWKEGTHDGGNGKLFYVITRALDGAGNAQTVFSTRTFRFDNVPPTSAPAAPIHNSAYRTLTTLSGTSVDDIGSVSAVSISIYDEEAARYFDGTGFSSIPEVWLPVLPANLFQTSWTFVNGSLAFTTQHHYLVKSSATDNVGNVQSAIGSSRFLFETDPPNSSVVNPLNQTTYDDTKILIGGSSDAGFTTGISGTGSGNVPTLGWHQGGIETVIFRDTVPLIAGGPIAFGGWDSTGFFWNGSTWVASSGGAIWVPATFVDGFGNWQYAGLTCPRPIPTDPCWVRGDPYVTWIRATDNAGNVQSVIQNGPRFFISGVAQSFSIVVSSNPSTVGNDVTVTVTARDGIGGAGGIASSYGGTVKFTMVDGTGGPETSDTDLVSDSLYGLPQDYTFTTGTGNDNGTHAFTIRLRKAGARILRVEQTDNAALFGISNLTAHNKVGTRVQLIADCDPAGQQAGPGVVTVGSEGRVGSPRTRTAGQTVNYCARITDDFYNLDSDSTTIVYVTDTDPNNESLSADQFLVVPGSVSFSRVFVTADPVGQVVQSTGSGVFPNASNPSSPVVVVGQPADRLLALLPNETRVQGKFAVAPFGKTLGAPDEVQAGSTTSLRVYAVDPFYNDDVSVALPVTARVWTDSFTGSKSQTLQSGVTTFVFAPVVAGTQSFQAQSASLPSATSSYLTPAPLRVWWAQPAKLQLLVEGQTPAAGKPPYDANPTTGGRAVAAPAILTAGVTTTLTVNLVDAWFNVVKATTPFMTQTASVTMPLAQLDFLNDPNIQGRGLAPNPFQRTLNAGTTTFSFIPATRSGGIALRVVDTTLTGTSYSTDTVSNAQVQANVPVSLLVEMPGETYAEGTVAGKTGSPSTLTAGSSYSVALRAVDLYNNRANDGRQVLLSSNDPYANIPPPQSLALGQTLFAGFLPSAATGNLVVSGVDNDVIVPALTGQTVSTITVIPGAPDRMIIALPGQTLVPGKTVAPFGVTGVPTQSTAGVFFAATAYATDSRYNVVNTVVRPTINVTSDDPFVPVVASVGMAAGAAAINPISLRTAGTRTLTATDPSGTPLIAGVSGGLGLLPNSPTRLRVMTPSETRVPGSTTNGRTGAAHTVQAGFAFDATVDIADAFWNLTPGVTQQIRLVADDPFAVIVPTTQVITSSAVYNVTLKRAGSTILRAEMVDTLSLPSVSQDSSTAITVLPGTPSRLLAVLPGESFSQGSPTGKGGTPSPQTAGTGFTVQVGVVDNFFNLVPARPANVLVSVPSDPYSDPVSTAAINTGAGFTAPMTVTLRRAATGHFLAASDFGPPPSGLSSDPQSSTFTVLPAAPYGLQLLLPGQTAVPGSGSYPNGGVTGAVSTPTAGAPFIATVNLVDRFMNPSAAGARPLVYVNTSDEYDVDPATSALIGGTLPQTLTLVTKSTNTVVRVNPQTSPLDEVCTANGPSNVCLAQAPAAVSVPFRVFASTAVGLQVTLPGETQKPGKCDYLPSVVCRTLGGGEGLPGKDGTPTPYVVTSPAMNADVWLVDAFNNPVSDIAVGPNQDTNPPAVMPTVSLSFPFGGATAVPGSAALILGNRQFNFTPLVAATGYLVVASTTPASASTWPAAQSAAFPVHPGPSHHMHWSGLPATVQAGVSFGGALTVHDQFHNVLSTGPNAYNKNVTFEAENFPGVQAPSFLPSNNVTFSSATDLGVKNLVSFAQLKKAGVRTLKAQETLDLTLTVNSERAGFTTPTTLTVTPAAPDSMKAAPLNDTLVSAGSLGTPGNLQITGQLTDAFDNPITAGASVYIQVVDVFGSTGSLAVGSGMAQVNVGASTVVVTDAQGRIGVTPEIFYFVSSTADDYARIWVGTTTAPSNLTLFVSQQKNVTGRLTTTGGAASSLVFLSTPTAATVGINDVAGAGGQYVIERRDDFGNVTRQGDNTILLNVAGSHKAIHAAAGRAFSQSGTSGDYGFRDAGNTSFIPGFTIFDGFTGAETPVRFHSRMSSYSGASPAANTAEGGRPGRWTLEVYLASPTVALTHQLRMDPAVALSIGFANPPRTEVAGKVVDFAASFAKFTPQLQDLFANPVVATQAVVVNLSTVTRIGSRHNDYVAFSRSSDSVAGTRTTPPSFSVSTTTVDIPLGQYQATFYYLDTTASTNYTLVGGTKPVIQLSAAGLFPSQQGVFILPDVIDRVAITTGAGQLLPAGATSQLFAYETRDIFGNASPVRPGQDFGLGYVQLQIGSNSSGQVQVSTGGAGQFVPGTAVSYLPVNQAASTFFLIDTLLTTAGSSSHTLSVSGVTYPSWDVGYATYGVNPGPPAQIGWATPPRRLIAGTTLQYEVGVPTLTVIAAQLLDQFGNVTSTSSPFIIRYNSVLTQDLFGGIDQTAAIDPVTPSAFWTPLFGNQLDVIIPGGASLSNAPFYMFGRLAGGATVQAQAIFSGSPVFAPITQVHLITPGRATYLTVNHPYTLANPLRVGVPGTLSVRARDLFGNIASGDPFNGNGYTGVVNFGSSGSTTTVTLLDLTNSTTYHAFTPGDAGNFSNLLIQDNVIETLKVMATDYQTPSLFGFTSDGSRVGLPSAPALRSDADVVLAGVLVTPTDLAPESNPPPNGPVPLAKQVFNVKPTLNQGDGNVASSPDPIAMLRMDLKVFPPGQPLIAELQSLRVQSRPEGNFDNNKITEISLWLDDPGAQNGQFEPLTDMFVASGAYNGAGTWFFGSGLFGQTALNALPPPVLGNMTINSSQSKFMFVAVRLSSSGYVNGELPASFGLEIPNPNNITLDPSSQVGIASNNFPIKTSTSSVEREASEIKVLTASTSDYDINAWWQPPTLALSSYTYVNQGVTNVGVMKLQMWTEQFNAVVSKISVGKSGTGLDTAIKKVKLYLDTQSDTVTTPGDGIFNFTIDRLVAETTFPPGETHLAAINIPTPTGVNGTIGTSTKTYYIVYDYEASAEPGQTHGAIITGANIVPLAGQGDPPSFTVIASSPVIVMATPDLVTLTDWNRQGSSATVPTDAIPSKLTQNDVNQPVAKITLRVNSGAADWTGLKLDRWLHSSVIDGSGPNSLLALNNKASDVTNVRVWLDQNGNGLLDVSTDSQVSPLNSVVHRFVTAPLAVALYSTGPVTGATIEVANIGTMFPSDNPFPNDQESRLVLNDEQTNEALKEVVHCHGLDLGNNRYTNCERGMEGTTPLDLSTGTAVSGPARIPILSLVGGSGQTIDTTKKDYFVTLDEIGRAHV